MKAVVCREFGLPERLSIEEIPSPAAEAGQVVVTVKAAGVNFPDVLIIQGKYQFQPPIPFSPGSEIAGIVKEVGEGVNGFKPGDSVIALPGFGGFAEEVACAPHQLIPLPGGMDFPTAAAFTMTYGTSHYALRDRGGLRPTETLVVLGAAGGVGLAAVEIGKALGARVIAAASSEEKLAVCRSRGADETIDYTTEDLKNRIKELTGGNGADVVYDPVGGSYSEPALRAMGWGGRYLVIGFAAGEIPRIPLNLPLLKSCSIVGVYWGVFAMREPERNQELLAELFGWHREGKIAPLVSARYPLERAAEALSEVMERRAHGKLVLVMD